MFEGPVILVTFAAVFLMSYLKGAFGGGFAVITIPLMSTVMSPLQAGALVAPLFTVQDLVALRYWRPAAWSKPDLIILIPGLIAGQALGWAALSAMSPRAVAIVIGAITIAFVVQWVVGGRDIQERPRSTWRASAAGLGSGLASMVAHAGGPPLAMYLLGLGLPKAVYAGTSSVFFAVGNVLKVGPWIAVAQSQSSGSTTALWGLTGLAIPVTVLGVWAGWRHHQRLSQKQVYGACYVLLAVTGTLLLWSGLFGS